MASNNNLPPLPKDHLSHPENWTTGSEPVTKNQEGFIHTLEQQNPNLVPEEGIDTSKLTKSEASSVIDKLKKGEELEKDEPSAEEAKKEERNVMHGNESASERDGTREQKEEVEVKSATKRKESSIDESNSKGSQSGSAKEIVEEPFNGTKKDEAGKQVKTSECDEDRPSKRAKAEPAEDPIEVDSPDPNAARSPSPTNEAIQTPVEAEAEKTPDAPIIPDGPGGNESQKKVDTTPGDDAHLDHPENWATGDQPATEKQKGFIKVLEKQKGTPGAAGDVDGLGKTEASERIEELKTM